jgi:predicted GH43/DUF377 family glycosyl hydrolase
MYIVKRSTKNPLIAPILEHHWESRATFNGCPVQDGKTTHLIYRAMGKADPLIAPHAHTSIIAKATSKDGENFHDRKPFITPKHDWEKYGCEDPRVTFFEGKYYIFYTALSEFPYRPAGIRVACAVSKDLKNVEERHLVTPFNAKAMTLFPERINGKVTVIFSAHTDEPPTHIAIAQANSIEDFWDPEFWRIWHDSLDSHTLKLNRFDEDHVEVGAPPIKTAHGWLLIYSYIQNYFKDHGRVFGIEALLFDKNDPHKIVGKTHGPIFIPEAPYEEFGMVSHIVFPSGAILNKNGKLDIYYGAADTVCAKVSVVLDDLMSSMTMEGRRSLVIRSDKNPIIAPKSEHPWESQATFNAGAFECGGEIHLLYRAMSADNTSTIGYASTKDGETLTERLTNPVYVPREEFEMKKNGPNGNSGCEDPRLTQIGKTIYMIYTAYDGVNPTRVALTSISEKDFLNKKFNSWSKPVLITPDNINDKDVCLFPKKINGHYMVLHRVERQICADFFDDLTFSTRRIDRCIDIMGPRPGAWDSEKIGIAGPPIETPAGWLLIYHGISKTKTYRLGAALLDLKDPTVILARTVDPIFEPLEDYEKTRYCAKCCFCL